MTPDQVRSALTSYADRLRKYGVEPVRISPETVCPTSGAALAHTLFMCEEALKLLEAGKWDKVQRWLGFIQASLWMSGIYSIAELKDHNR
jgi:hypothetical protein